MAFDVNTMSTAAGFAWLRDFLGTAWLKAGADARHNPSGPFTRRGSTSPRHFAAAGGTPPCLRGLANVDNAYLANTTLTEAQRCVFSGVPAATEMPSAKTYVHQHRATFGQKPSVWGSFTYDSAQILFGAIDTRQEPTRRRRRSPRYLARVNQICAKYTALVRSVGQPIGTLEQQAATARRINAISRTEKRRCSPGSPTAGRRTKARGHP